MKRRPHQNYYRPGSGSLRKSNSGTNENESNSNFVSNFSKPNHLNYSIHVEFKIEGQSHQSNMEHAIESFDNMSIKDNMPKRNKKPDKEIYIPRMVAQNKKPDHIRDDQSREEMIGDNDKNFQGSNGRRYENYNEHFKPKRPMNKRRGNDNRDNRDDWNDKNTQRQLRQGSEPRGTHNSNRDSYNWQRTRDTRSVEPFGPQNYHVEKSYSNKPPSGRRHSTSGLERLNEIPPRFRKKMLEEAQLKNLNPPEETPWDGNSVTFKGSTGPQNYDSRHGSYSTLPNNHALQHDNHGGNYSTLPNRSRGRGRFSHDQYDHSNVGRVDMKRPPTPPSYNNTCYENGNYGRPNSRPHTPSFNRNDDKYHLSSRQSSQERYRKNNNPTNRRSEERFSNRRNGERGHNRNKNNDYHREPRKEMPRENLRRDPPKQNDSPPKKQETEDQSSSTSPADVIESRILEPPGSFDWSEEVELNFKMEAEALSDALSSSITSLVENSVTTAPTRSEESRNSRKSKGSPSDLRDRSSNRSSNDNFKFPADPPRRRRQSRDRRDSSYERFGRSSHSRECSFDRIRKTSINEHGNWRDEIRTRQEKEVGRKDSDETRRSRQNSEEAQNKISTDNTLDITKPGILVIQQTKTHDHSTMPPSLDHPRYADARKNTTSMGARTRSLFDPNNPNKPIIVKNSNVRAVPGIPENKDITPSPAFVDQYGNVCPEWYREDSEEYAVSRYPNMIQDVKRADQEIQYAIHSGIILQNWSGVETFRSFLKEALQYFLCKDLKFSQTGNIEHHFWKLLYYNIIERVRKAIQEDEASKEHYKKFALYLVDEGTQYFEKLLKMFEETYQFQLSDYLGVGHSMPPKGLGYVGLALISAHKIFIFLGDLARYKEQINETTNYGKCRQWYIKAHELNPKNGRPYKQLAFLAVCARRKLDAVYYYMRSLMASNPVQTSRDDLKTLFYENSKKYEQGEKKRREERLERVRQHMKEKENEKNSNFPTSIRRETWIRPDGGRRVHRTTQAVQEDDDSEEENLAALSSVEVNKRFVISYLHVHGKLITRIEMDSFQEAAMQMLKEFRALLQHSPLPLQSTRLLQLLALNMYAIESNQLKDPELQQNVGYRSEYQERALIVSLQMFNLILERCVSILEEHFASKPEQINSVSMDAHVLLPSIKIWCDWMLCHSSIWNPPPSIQEYKVGSPGDTWTRLANLINLLGQFDQTVSSVFETKLIEGHDQLRLPEDNVLSGFTPLMLNVDEPTYIPKNYDVEAAQFVLRVRKLLFFGTEFLCGLEPPVLKLEIDNDSQEYISVVSTSNSRDSPQSVEEMRINNEVLTESFSEDEQEVTRDSLSEDTSSEVRDLLNRKNELERKHRNHELHMERVKKILSQSVIKVHINVQPKYLVPDTNCFIDHLGRIVKIINAQSSPYVVMVPITVLGELEGLSRGGKAPVPKTRSSVDPDHTKKVAESARKALSFLKNRHVNLKCVTTKGAVFHSTTFTTEDDTSSCLKNDDKILTTCLNLSKVHRKEDSNNSEDDGEPRQLFREVVLLTDDRNLRVKALSTDVPVRELPDFMKWAGLG